MSSFEFNRTEIDGLYEVTPKIISDERGLFVKTFQFKEFSEIGIDFSPKEEFFSVSSSGVLRGMHFQNPPADHSKLVYCLSGEVLDVVVDLRNGSGFAKIVSRKLDAVRRNMLFIPKGCAHGFFVTSGPATLSYVTDSEYCRELDGGIHWDSIGFEWPAAPSLVSPRDSSHQKLAEFRSPF
jgi:dTDP-4-dehydrorhamnose 3,5-epimerase